MLLSRPQQLAAIGERLGNPPFTKDGILKNLKQAAGVLSELDQAPEASATLLPLTRALIHPNLVRHKDKDVRLLATTCIMEIMRIVAPQAPYSDAELKEIFQLIVASFQGLEQVSSPSFTRRTGILEIMAKYRICVVMLDVECDELILEMFHIFFAVVSDKHPPSVPVAMQTVMHVVLQESEEISQPLLDTIMANLLKQSKNVSPTAHKLAVSVVQHCAEKLEPYVQRFLTSVMLEGKASESDLREDYHDVIYEIYQCAPQMLLAVIPNLTKELVTDQVDVRLKALQLVGRLFALPGQQVAKEYHQLFGDFLRRFHDKALEVRLAMVGCAKECFKANPSGVEATEILAGLSDRILDSEENVRLQVVIAVSDLAKSNMKLIPMSILRHVAERLRDKKVLVRKETLQNLAEVYRAYCMKRYEGQITLDEKLEWIPSKLIRCCYDKEVKEFRPAGLEVVFSENLFPRELPVEERTRHWISFYMTFDENDKKALARILSQKQRLQEDMAEYLSFRQKEKGNKTQEVQDHLQQLFKAMSLTFVDDRKAEECFQKLHQMKDNNIFKGLSELLDSNTTFSRSQVLQDELLKRIGENHPQHEFMRLLLMRCSFMLFGQEHVKAVIQEVFASKAAGNKDVMTGGLSLLAEFAGFFPYLIEIVKEDLVHFLMEDDDSVKERVAEILAKAGSSICGKIGEANSSIELTLQKLCLEGSRKQAKYAVSALSAITADSGFRSLSILYGRLVDSLQEDHPHLPTVLQSLSCIAQNAITIFETQEDDIIRFVVRKLLRLSSNCEFREDTNLEATWETQSTPCNLKIFGLKTLVKSFLPHKEHPRKRLMGLLGVLFTLISNGELSEDVKSGEIDKAHVRLAAAKGVLRLARRWDAHIPPQLFEACLLTAQDPSIHVRRRFLAKVHQFLKDHTLSHKYASAFAVFALDPSKELLVEAKEHLAEFVEVCCREARLRLASALGQNEAPSIAFTPEYVLMYLVHFLAHHPAFPELQSGDTDAYEPFYRILHFFLRSLVHQEGDGLGKKEETDNLPAILAIFQTVKKAEDAVLDSKTGRSKTESLHTVCDLGIVIAKELAQNRLYSESYPGVVPLPSLLYKAGEDSQPNTSKVDGSDLPSCLTESDVLTQFWSRSSRFGKLSHPHHYHRRGKRNATEDFFLHKEEKDYAEVPLEKWATDDDFEQHTIENQESRRPFHPQKKALPKKPKRVTRKKGSGDLKSGYGHKSTSENGTALVKQDVTVRLTRQTARSRKENGELTTSDKNLGQTRPNHEETTLSETRSGSEIPLVASNGDGVLAQPSVREREQDTVPQEVSPARERRVAKRLKLEKQSDQKEGDFTVTSESNQRALSDVFSTRSSPRHINLGKILVVSGRKGGKVQSVEEMKMSSRDTASPQGSQRRAIKRITVSGIESPSWKAESDREADEKLVGRRIRVWWPLDRRYYEGVVQAFESRKKEHQVRYDDGDVEHLCLFNERWDIIGEDSANKHVAPDVPSTYSGSLTNNGGKDIIGDITCTSSFDGDGSVQVHNGKVGRLIDGFPSKDQMSAPSERVEEEMLQRPTEVTRMVTRMKTRKLLGCKEAAEQTKAGSTNTGGENTTGMSDDEPTTTWRSRRRKVL